MAILGIETSCDDTSAALVSADYQIESSIVSSQVEFHRKYGGVVPEIASRHHLSLINPIINEALFKANRTLDDLKAVAVTSGPGLVGALLVGMSTAKAISLAMKIPLISVNHLEGHIFANFLEKPELEIPFVCLIASGGHTVIVFVHQKGEYELLGQTLDDAAGEAFDKVAKFLGLGYPGGPIVEKLAKQGYPEAVEFTRPMLHSADYNFSFSGIKTAVIYHVERLKREGSRLNIPDICASFQQAVVDVLVEKTIRAALGKKVKTIALAGGVAANSRLREVFKKACGKSNLKLIYPKPELCTDNAAMISAAAIYKFQRKLLTNLNATVDPNLQLGGRSS